MGTWKDCNSFVFNKMGGTVHVRIDFNVEPRRPQAQPFAANGVALHEVFGNIHRGEFGSYPSTLTLD
jgi:hypothetical protein